MKLSNVFAKLTSKSNVVRTLAATTLAGAALIAATPAAQAQHFAVGVQFGGPRYFAPPPPPPRFYGPGYGYGYDRYRYEEFRRHEDWRYHHPEFRYDHRY